MKKFFCFIYLACLVLPLAAQDVLSLDSCRTLAIANNKELLIGPDKNRSGTLPEKSGIHQLSTQHFRHRRIHAQPERVLPAE